MKSCGEIPLRPSWSGDRRQVAQGALSTRFAEEKSVEKIDGIVASIMALDRYIRNGTGSGSVYDERGVIAF